MERKGWRRLVCVAILAFAFGGCSTVPRSFHPSAPISPHEFSHRLFDDVLRDHVADGVVDYPGIAGDRRFGEYLGLLDRVNPNALPTGQDRLAYWINAYNAFAIKGILEGHSPLTLIGRYRYFIGTTYRVGGEAISLYDLEQHLLIPDFREPRMHFAIVCASRSCPKLQPRACQPDRLEQQLEAGARAFVNDPTRNRFDRREKVAYLSMIFKWFEEDFAAHSGSLLGYVKRYVADPGLAGELDAVPYRVEFLPYDWGLNGIPLEEDGRAGSS
ncbi:MAG: DUF547 domain-containing protein [Nitrospirota bacterium]